MAKDSYSDLRMYLSRPIFVTFDVFGFLIVSLSLLFPMANLSQVMISVGATVFTLGITLPVALYYQAKQSSESFKILKTCESAGIKSIFVSRHKDSKDLQDAIENAAQRSSPEIFLLGIAFPNFLDPNEARTPSIRERFDNPNVCLRLLILDPESQAAKERSKIEIGSTTKDDIESTINVNIVSLIETRIKHLEMDKCDVALQVLNRCKKEDNISDRSISDMASKTNVEVRLYEKTPITFIIGLSEDLFTEQYHLGRPRALVRPKGCIGKHVPVIQYKKDSEGYAFLKSHFDYLWSKGKDISNERMGRALRDYLREDA